MLKFSLRSFVVVVSVSLLNAGIVTAQEPGNKKDPVADLPVADLPVADAPVADAPGTPTAEPPVEGQPVDPAADVPTKVVRSRDPRGGIQIERSVFVKGGKYVNHGAWMASYPDGKEFGGGDYLHGKRHGKWWRWFEPGEAMFGSPLYREYRGPFKSVAHFVEGEIHGPWVILDWKERKISEWHFAAGQPHGDWTWFYTNGQVRRHCTYVEGVLDGEIVETAPDGKLLSKDQFVLGRPRRHRVGHYGPRVKQWEGWYLYPKEVTKTSYEWWQGEADTQVVGVKGEKLRDGKWTWWFPDGQKQVEGLYVADLRVGPWTWWHPNGAKWHEGVFVGGKKSGEWMHWKPNGEVERKEIFPEIAAPEAEVPADGVPLAEPPGGSPAPADSEGAATVDLPVAGESDK